MKDSDEILIYEKWDISWEYTRGDILKVMREYVREGVPLETVFGENIEAAVQKIAEAFSYRCQEYFCDLDEVGPVPRLDEWLWCGFK